MSVGVCGVFLLLLSPLSVFTGRFKTVVVYFFSLKGKTTKRE